MSQIDVIMSFVERGWHPYAGKVDAEIYEALSCPAPIFGKWLYEGTRAQEAVCVGCDRQCRTSCDNGFSPHPARMQYLYRGSYFTLSPSEMLKRFPLLRVNQAAYCLNISERKVYDLIAEGALPRTKSNPCRVSSADVAKLMAEFE